MSPPTIAPLLLDVTQVAEMLSLCPRQIQKLTSKGHFPKPIKIARSTRWRAAEIEAWVARGCEMESKD